MKKLLLLVVFISGCSDHPVETVTFRSEFCRKEFTGKTEQTTIQSGCAMYGTNSDGTSNGVCIAPVYSNIEYKQYKYSCEESVME